MSNVSSDSLEKKLVQKRLKVSEVLEYKNNARLNDKTVEALTASMESYGITALIIIDKNNVILAGHARLKAIKKLGHKEVDVLCVDWLAESDANAYRILDNKIQELSEWNSGFLKEELRALDDLSDFKVHFPEFSNAGVFDRVIPPESAQDDSDPDELSSAPKEEKRTVRCPYCDYEFTTMLYRDSIRTPMTYYGGKQNLSRWIRSFIPPHKTYIEPFCGGLALFFKAYKDGVDYVINDINSNISNFWTQVRDNNDELHALLDNTFYSREDFEHCLKIDKGLKTSSGLERARATFVLSCFSFSSCMKSFKYSVPSGKGRANKVEMISKIKKMMKNVFIENRDALSVIKRFDSKDSFFYIDPPYIEANQGPYAGYKNEDFYKLIDLLKNIKGKFILSNYEKNLELISIPKTWKVYKKDVFCASEPTKESGDKKTIRTEIIIMNFISDRERERMERIRNNE